MPIPVYSIRMYAAHGLNGSSPPFGPPSGTIWIVRDLDATYSGLLVASIRLLGSLGETVWLNAFAGGDQPQYASFRGRQVIPEGETFSISTSGACDVRISGYELTLP